MTQLDQLAARAHRNGQSWAAFHAEHGSLFDKAVPFDRGKRRKLANRLRHVVSFGAGDCQAKEDGRGRMPWEVDDSAPPIGPGKPR